MIAISISLLDKILLVQVNFHTSKSFETCEPLRNPTMGETAASRILGNPIHIDCDRNSHSP